MKLSEHCDDLKQEAETLRTQLEQVCISVQSHAYSIFHTLRKAISAQIALSNTNV